MKKYIFVNGEIAEIDDLRYNDLLSKSKSLTRYRMLIINWLTYHESLKNLENFLKTCPKLQIGTNEISNIVLANVYVGNVLNCQYAFAQYFEKEFTCNKAILSKYYDLKNDISYRFMYHLRAYSTHKGCPVLQISQDLDMKTMNASNTKFKIKKSLFCSYDGCNSAVREEVDKSIKEEDIDVYPYLKKVDRFLSAIVNELLVAESEYIESVYKEITSLSSDYNSKTKLYLISGNDIEMYLSSHLYSILENIERYTIKKGIEYHLHPVSKTSVALNNMIIRLKEIICL